MTLQALSISKQFNQSYVLENINLSIQEGEFVSLCGKSGSGKSTLLYILSSLDTASSGEVIMDGQKLSKITPQQLHILRNEKIGFVFQFHYLLPELSALENVLMPTFKKKIDKKKDAIDLLTQVGLKDKLNRLPKQLSGGEQQRVAIARALIMNPQYLFADEPTGNLDSNNGEKIMAILKEMNQEKKTTIVMVTHDPDFAEMANRKITLSDGKIISE